MENISTTASRRSSFSQRPPHPKYKQIFSHQEALGSRGYSPAERINANTQFIQSLQGQITKKINGSYFFTPGKQEKNNRFAEVFVDFFRNLRGIDPLVNASGDVLASKFVTSPDMCRIHKTSTVDEYGIDTTTEYSPTSQLINELNQILEDEYGLQDQFINALDKNGKRINDFAKLEDRDLFLATLPKNHPYRQKWGLQTAPVYISLSAIAKLFPKCVEAVKEVFNSLLITQWLEKDIEGVKLYLGENNPVSRPLPSDEEHNIANEIWIIAKATAEHQKQHDSKIEAKHWNELQNDLWGTMVSGGLSICTVNPSFVIGKAAHTMMNVLSNQVDPEGKDKRMQVLKMLGGAGLGGALGGNPWDLGTSLGVDLVELAVRDQKTTKGESALLGLWGNVLKGVLTGDQKKAVCQVLGGCVAEAINQIPETDENTSLERRIARALITNSDVQAHYIKQYVDKRFKDEPKPKIGGVLTPEEQEKYPKQIITEVEPEQPVKIEMQNESLYLKLVEEQKQNQVDLNLAQADCEAKRKAAEKASKEEHKLHEKNKGFKLIPKPKKYQEWLDSKKTLATKTGEYQTSLGHVSEIQEKIYNNSKAQLVASSPKVPTTQTDKGLAVAITNLNRIDREIPKKILAIEKSIDNYNEHYRKDSYFSEVKRTIKDLNSSLQERDTEQNNINKLNGVESNIQTPLIAIPDKASALAKVILWCKDNIVLGIHPPQQPFNYDPNKPIPPESNKGSIYHETRHQINLEQSELNVLEEKSRPVSQGSNWSSVSYYHSQRMFETNMAYHSPVDTSSQGNLDYQQFWGQGLNPNVQIPPSDWSGLGRNEIAPYQNPQRNIPIKMAGLLPFVLTNVVPEHTQRKVETWVKGFIQQWKDDPIKARKDLDLCLILGAKNTVVIAIQAFEQPSLKSRPNTFGLMEASDKFDNWFAGKANIDLTSPIAQLGMFVGEFAMPIPMVGAFKHCTKVGQEAFAFMRQSARLMRPQPLLDRALAFPQGFSKEVRAIEALQTTVYRSGFVHNKAIQQARKAVNLPSWKKMTIDMKHTVSGHIDGGWRTGCKENNKTLFPEGFSEKQVEKIIRQAYRNGKKVKTRDDRCVVIGEYEGIKIKMHVDVKNKIIKTAYPTK